MHDELVGSTVFGVASRPCLINNCLITLNVYKAFQGVILSTFESTYLQLQNQRTRVALVQVFIPSSIGCISFDSSHEKRSQIVLSSQGAVSIYRMCKKRQSIDLEHHIHCLAAYNSC